MEESLGDAEENKRKPENETFAISSPDTQPHT